MTMNMMCKYCLRHIHWAYAAYRADIDDTLYCALSADHLHHH